MNSALLRLIALMSLVMTAEAHGETVTLDLTGQPRSEALAELIPAGSAEVTWRNPALASVPLQGHFEGTPEQVLKQLLQPAGFAATYSDVDGELKITKLIILDNEVTQSESTPASAPPPTTPLVASPSQYQLEKQRKIQMQQLEQQQRQRMLRAQRMQQQQGVMPGGGQIPPGGHRMLHPVQPDQ